MSPTTDVPAARRGARAGALALLAAAAATAALAAWWAASPAPFVAHFRVDYAYPLALQNHLRNLRDLPKLLAWVALALAALGAALLRARRRGGPALASLARRAPAGWGAAALALAVLLAVDVWLSQREWTYWGRPIWDDYPRYGEAFHRLFVGHDAAALARFRSFAAGYLHAPSPLTPAALGLLRFAVPDAVACMQLTSLLATAISLLLLLRLSQRIAPALPTWFPGVLFLGNAATIRNSFFVQLDAASSCVALLFLWRWERWLARRRARDAAWLCVCAILAVLQKTTLFPLLVLPPLVAAIGWWRSETGLREVARMALVTLAAPLAVFAAWLGGLGLLGNFRGQVDAMGTGWNVLDHSLGRFAFATGFLLGPVLPFALASPRRIDPLRLGMLLFAALFLGGIAVTGGPFWSRYYSHILAPCLLAAAPGFERAGALPGSRDVLLVYLAGTAAVGYAMMAWHIS
jgi:hypothetical protein